MHLDSALYKTEIITPLGTLLAFANAQGICRTEFKDSPISNTSKFATQNLINDSNLHLINLASQLDEYFLGHRTEFSLPLNIDGSIFQTRVWQSLLSIPYGITVSYKEQAIALKNPLAVRAIASANGQNPLSILVPCHRVIAANGKLAGYSGGLWRKKWLLEHERKHAPMTYRLL